MQLAEMHAILNAVSISALLSLLHVSFLIERVNSRGNSAAGLDVPPRWRRLLPGFTAWQAVKLIMLYHGRAAAYQRRCSCP